MSKTKTIKATHQKPSDVITLAPASVPQEQFLASSSTITLYAGSAGAGKSFALVLNMVKFADKKNSTIVCFRRTSTQLRAPGSIWSEATKIFSQVFKDCKIRSREMEIYIPSRNSVVKFSHLQHEADVLNHLGAQYSAVFYDEVTTFPFETFVLPLMGRMRNALVDYTPQMFWATNPQYDHGVYHWIKDFYLDEHGIPFKERSNVERYFVLKDSKPVWYNTLAEAEAIHGAGIPRSFRSIRAHVTDNIPLMKANPDYLSNLLALPEIKRRIYLDGSWTAREEEAGYFKRAWVKIVPYPSLFAVKRVRAWDLASSPISTANPAPDWTRGTLVSKDKDSYYTIEDVASMRDRPHEVEQLIYKTARNDPPGTIVCIPCDPGQAGAGYANMIKRNLAEMGVFCRLIKPTKSKLQRFLPFSAIAEAGYVRFVKLENLDELFDELERFNGERRNGFDDFADTLSDAMIILNTGLELPTMNISVNDTPPVLHFQGYHQGAPQVNTLEVPTFKF